MLSRLFLRRSRRRAAVCALAAASLAFFYSGDISLADERDDAVANQNEAQRKQQEVVSSLEGVSADLGQAYISLQSAQTSLTAAETELTSAETTLAEKEREKQIASDRLTTAQNSLDTVKQESEASKKTASETSDSVAEIVVSTYQGDNSVTSWSYVLASQDVEDLNQRASAVEIGSGVQEAVLSAAEVERAQNANRESRQNAATTRVGTLKSEADTAEENAKTARDTAQTKRDDVARLAAEKQAAASALESRKSDLQTQLDQANADAAAAAARVAEIDAANRAAASAGSMPSVPSSSIASDSLGDGYIGHPITGPLEVTSPFGYRVHPVTGAGTGHQGVDFAASEGTPQYASVSGVATYWNSESCGIGIDINGGIIDGHSYVITLCHLSGRAIADGQYVNRGDVVGSTGSTGYATGAHVHFQVAQDGVYIDPMSLPGF